VSSLKYFERKMAAAAARQKEEKVFFFIGHAFNHTKRAWREIQHHTCIDVP
jgi:hypothetical protein